MCQKLHEYGSSVLTYTHLPLHVCSAKDGYDPHKCRLMQTCRCITTSIIRWNTWEVEEFSTRILSLVVSSMLISIVSHMFTPGQAPQCKNESGHKQGACRQAGCGVEHRNHRFGQEGLHGPHQLSLTPVWLDQMNKEPPWEIRHFVPPTKPRLWWWPWITPEEAFPVLYTATTKYMCACIMNEARESLSI